MKRHLRYIALGAVLYLVVYAAGIYPVIAWVIVVTFIIAFCWLLGWIISDVFAVQQEHPPHQKEDETE